MENKTSCNDVKELGSSEGKPEWVKKHCLGCFCSKDERNLYYFKFQSASLKEIFQMDAVWLCFVCKRIAQHTESFIQCVQGNQIMLENFHSFREETIKSVQTQSQLVNLTCMPFNVLELSDADSHLYEDTFTVIDYGRRSKEPNVKLELKEEEFLDHLEGEFINGGDEFSDAYVKHEDGYPLKELLKEEIEDLDSIDLLSLSAQLNKNRRGKKKAKIKKEISKRKKEKVIKEKGPEGFPDSTANIKTVYLTREQCLSERQHLRQQLQYRGCVFKCEDCLKGFNLKSSFDKHMEKHSESIGDFECDICRLRLESHDKLMAHMRYHFVRYRCAECGLTRICRMTIKDHFTSTHCQDYQYICSHCTKCFKRQVSLRKHISYVHNKKERVKCTYCLKTYATKEVLRSHLLMMHTKEVSAGAARKRYPCTECGASFQSPSQLRNHGTKHSQRRDYYCVECDKSFKSDSILKTHLKTAAPHVNYVELPLPCDHCDKRFAIRRDLDRHVNRIHLNVKPFQCDRCDKAYTNNWTLTNHKKMIHDGYKRPLRYPCQMCDKVFTRPQILKAHIRTHTGERPYQCTKCSAAFSQSSILRTHDRLIHLKQTRDGRPKAICMK